MDPAKVRQNPTCATPYHGNLRRKDSRKALRQDVSGLSAFEGHVALRKGIEARVTAALSYSRTHNRPALFFWRERVKVVDPLSLLEWYPPAITPSFYWESPESYGAERVLGLGVVDVVEADGEGRFETMSARCLEILEQLPNKSFAASLRWFGGFAFTSKVSAPESHWSGFGSGRFVLPELTLSLLKGNATFQCLAQVTPGDDVVTLTDRFLSLILSWRERLEGLAELPFKAPRPQGLSELSLEDDPDVAASQYWMKAVGNAASQIKTAADTLEKVVLARQVELSANADLSIPWLLNTLRRRQPGCHIFMVSEVTTSDPESPGRVFLGASPELLVHKAGATLRTDALAGSAPLDALPGRLLDSPKERLEHALVVNAIEHALSEHCKVLHVPASPHLLKLATIQHLRTPIRGQLAKPLSLLEVADRLHPTPAVCGLPVAQASALIQDVEAELGFERGWYAGGVGWTDVLGDGHLAVALRSALVDGQRAHLFAGAGIVGDSQPKAEFAETGLKLQAIARALGEVPSPDEGSP